MSRSTWAKATSKLTAQGEQRANRSASPGSHPVFLELRKEDVREHLVARSIAVRLRVEADRHLVFQRQELRVRVDEGDAGVLHCLEDPGAVVVLALALVLQVEHVGHVDEVELAAPA